MKCLNPQLLTCSYWYKPHFLPTIMSACASVCAAVKLLGIFMAAKTKASRSINVSTEFKQLVQWEISFCSLLNKMLTLHFFFLVVMQEITMFCLYLVFHDSSSSFSEHTPNIHGEFPLNGLRGCSNTVFPLFLFLIWVFFSIPKIFCTLRNHKTEWKPLCHMMCLFAALDRYFFQL